MNRLPKPVQQVLLVLDERAPSVAVQDADGDDALKPYSAWN